MEMHDPQPLGRAEVTSLFVTPGSRPQLATCGCIRSCDSGGGGGAAAGSRPKLLELLGKLASNLTWLSIDMQGDSLLCDFGIGTGDGWRR